MAKAELVRFIAEKLEWTAKQSAAIFDLRAARIGRNPRPLSLSLPHGCTFSYMSIPPSEGVRSHLTNPGEFFLLHQALELMQKKDPNDTTKELAAIKVSEIAIAEGDHEEFIARAPTGRVVDEDKQRTGVTPLFEPAMVAAIDLDQLAEGLTAQSRLMEAAALLAGTP